METNSLFMKNSLLFTDSKTKPVHESKNNNKDIELLDISDDDQDDDNVSNQFHYSLKIKRINVLKGEPINIQDAIELKRLILGSPKKLYPQEWSQQYFYFSDYESVFYGLVQNKGGPCGVLASLQAYILIELFFDNQQSTTIQQKSDKIFLRKCLSKAIANILMNISGDNLVILAIENTSIALQQNSEFTFDGITERIYCTKFDNFDSLHEQIINSLENNNNSIGCVSFLYSCILTRGLAQIKQDFDDETITLIGKHNYCTQEIINLMLTGRAVSNVFNNNVKCDNLILKGINHRVNVGFLSLFEHYKVCEVGSYYKNPLFPIWIVLSESHFSVLFCKNVITQSDNQFDLYYYDGLVGQQHQIKLTIRLGKNDELKNHKSSISETKQLIPLECIIKTKWSNAIINWNSTNPIL